MALTEETKIDRVEILEDGQMQVREARIIYDNGVEISRAFNRYVLDPAVHQTADIPANEGVPVQAVAEAVWTPEVVSAREEVVAAQAVEATPIAETPTPVTPATPG